MSRNRIKLPSGLELVRQHIAVVVHRDDGDVTVCVVGCGQYCLTGDAAAFHAWWDAPKAKRVKAKATPEAPAEPKPRKRWHALPECGTSLPRVNNSKLDMSIQIVGYDGNTPAANALAERVARLLNESEVTG